MQSVEFNQRTGWLQAAKSITAGRKGLLELSRGLLPCALRSIPACATMFATVDIVRDHLNKRLIS